MRNFLITAVLFLAALCASVPKSEAVTFTSIIDTPEEFSFNFTGSGYASLSDFDTILSSNWNVSKLFSEGSTDWVWGMNVSHGATGPLTGFVFVGALYGSPDSTTEVFAHDAGFDAVTMSMTVFPSTSGSPWGDFLGRFEVKHPSASGIPDTGTTAMMLGLALIGLVGLRRRLG